MKLVSYEGDVNSVISVDELLNMADIEFLSHRDIDAPRLVLTAD